MPQRRRGQHWLIYALGGGMGHLTRATALARAATVHPRNRDNCASQDRASRRITIVTNTSYAQHLPLRRELGPACRVVRIEPTAGQQAILRCLSTIIEADPPDVFLVDTFPRGLGGELAELIPDLDCPRLLIHRDLTPRYAERAAVRRSIDHFDHILLPGETGPFQGMKSETWTMPWLVRDFEELHGLEESRRILGATDDPRPVIAVVGCGRENEETEMRRIAAMLARDLEHLAVVRFAAYSSSSKTRCGTPAKHRAIRIWPLLAVHRGIRLVIGGGGYNTVYETQATRTPLIAVPRPRLYDRQERRLPKHACAHDYSHILAQAEKALHTREEGDIAQRYVNGVHQAVETINLIRGHNTRY